MIERREDVRYFLARLARAVRQGLLEVHAFCLLTTHFHLLVRSLEGELSRAMCEIQGPYSKRFNRTRRRDGSLVRNRFASRIVHSDTYRDNVIRYIDANAVEAGIVALPQWHLASSARFYGGNHKSPQWLERSWIERRVCEQCGLEQFDPAAYLDYYRPRLSAGMEKWILRRLQAGEGAPDPLDDLIDAAPDKVMAWMQRKASLADGTRAAIPLVPGDIVDEQALAAGAQLLAWANAQTRRRRTVPFLDVARAGLLVDVAATTHREVGVLLGRSPKTIQSWVRMYRTWIRESAVFGAIVADIVHSSLHRLQ